MSNTAAAIKAQAQIEMAYPGKFRFSSNDGVCRKIKHSEDYSQHSWGNALDIWGKGSDLESLYWYLRSGSSREILKTRTVCYNHKGGCTTSHESHLHVDFNPKQTGIPPCAQKDDEVELTKLIQTGLNDGGFSDPNGKPLKVDGKPGPKTEYAFSQMCVSAGLDPELPATIHLSGGTLELETDDAGE